MTDLPSRAAHDRIAGIYDRRWRRYVEATVGRAVASMERVGDAMVLDVATGTGELVRRLRASHPHASLVGADLSLGMLRQAIAKAAPPGARWVQASAAQLPFLDETFDWVVCVNSFHCFREPARALQEMRRVLRPGGQLLLLDWCDDYLTCKLCSIWLRWTDSAFYQAYTTRTCRQLLEETGFTVERQEHFRVGWLWGMMQFTAH